MLHVIFRTCQDPDDATCGSTAQFGPMAAGKARAGEDTVILILVLLAGGLALLVFEQVRVSKIDPAKRTQLSRRRGFLRQPRDAPTYLRQRFIPAMAALSLIGVLVVAMSASTQSPNRARETFLTAIVVLAVLATLAVIGRLTYRRIAEDQRRGLAEEDRRPGPW